ncbi:MAG: ABC transporter ATP-binding protein [Candidatus Eisenbacteria bacterium]|nr:ABC transporter ATP-binding protein [Candidatus Eisenbacteria bacterium]
MILSALLFPSKRKVQMTDVVIEIEGLTKRLGEIEAVNNLNLTVNRGEMFSIVGPDGAGKTTTMRMLCGIARPTSGNVKILGYDLRKDLEEIKKHIGYLSQRFSLYGDLTIDENIEFFAEIHEVGDYKRRREELLEFTRLTPFRTRLSDKLSGGMKQKLALACTLIHTPQIIFLDEPTTGVDPVSRRDFWKILSNLLKTGITIVMTTPYLDEAERCTRVGLMNKGSLMMADTPHNIKKLMKGTIIEVVCSEIRRASAAIKQLPGASEVQVFGDRLNVVVQDKDRDLPVMLDKLRNEGIEITNWRVIQPSLENIFISLLKNRK